MNRCLTRYIVDTKLPYEAPGCINEVDGAPLFVSIACSLTHLNNHSHVCTKPVVVSCAEF